MYLICFSCLNPKTLLDCSNPTQNEETITLDFDSETTVYPKSPGFPPPYDGNLHISWHAIAPDGARIKLIVQFFQVMSLKDTLSD